MKNVNATESSANNEKNCKKKGKTILTSSTYKKILVDDESTKNILNKK